MKSIRTASATKYIDEADQNVTLFMIQEILSEHRAALIMRILNDLPTYLQFKFYARVDNGVQSVLREKLLALSESKVNFDRYDAIVKEINRNTNYRVPPQEFFNEIDALLEAELNPKQLTLI
ncbi:MAG TPA: hypothetical protein VEW65_10275 [Chryseolinea sp.]|nr:hypothetical protein [Chryseolinea sp.]